MLDVHCRVRDLSEDETILQRCDAIFLSQEHAQIHAQILGIVLLRDDSVPVCRHRAKADLLFQSFVSNDCGAGFITLLPSFPSGNLGHIKLSMGDAAEKLWSCSFHQVCLQSSPAAY